MQAGVLTWTMTITNRSVSAAVPGAVCGAVVALAASGRGFGAASKNKKNFPDERKLLRKMKGKLIGCVTCGGTGKKACIVCKRSGVMQGLLGATVPCYPCQGKGISGRPCLDCKGIGFHQM